MSCLGRQMRGRAGGLSLLVAAALGCWHGPARYFRCDAPNHAPAKVLPKRLSVTGLYQAGSTERIAPNHLEYQPRFELWSNGAAKRRFLWLPPGAVIDTRDPNDWQFPVGTRLYKEFSLHGQKLETRVLQRIGPKPQDWVGVSYLWSEDRSEAVAVPQGVSELNHATHAVPSAAECSACHGGRRSMVLGVSAVQLSKELARQLSDCGALRQAFEPLREVPGDEVAQQALGYLHANCSHCHNQSRPQRVGARCYDPEATFDLSLYVDQQRPRFRAAVLDLPLGDWLVPGSPEQSEVYERMVRGSWLRPRMPPLGVQVADKAGPERLRAWIESLSSFPPMQGLEQHRGAGSWIHPEAHPGDVGLADVPLSSGCAG